MPVPFPQSIPLLFSNGIVTLKSLAVHSLSLMTHFPPADNIRHSVLLITDSLKPRPRCLDPRGKNTILPLKKRVIHSLPARGTQVVLTNVTETRIERFVEIYPLLQSNYSRLRTASQAGRKAAHTKKKMVIPATHIGQANQPVCGLERAGYGGHSWNELGDSAPLSRRDREH